MIKGLIVFGLMVAIVFLGTLTFGAVNTYANENRIDSIVFNYNQHGMMGSNDDVYSLERIYLYLSTENQEKIDYTFASEIKEVDLQQKNREEVVSIIKQIKTDILNDVQFEYSSYRYGMMSGNMMGFNGDESDINCSYQQNAYTFEWLYMHSSSIQRDSLDTSFAEAIMMLDVSNLSIQELVERIQEIKTILVNQFSYELN